MNLRYPPILTGFLIYSASAFLPIAALATITIPLSVTLSEAVTVTGTPQIAVDVGGTTRYATYTSGSGTTALTFTLSPQAGDVDLDGITVSSPIQLNGGTIKDAAGNDATLTFTPPNTSGIKVNYPSLSMDFVYDADGRYTLNGTAYNDLTSFLTATGGSFTRSSVATYFDSTGTLQTAAANQPRFDYDPVSHQARGILIEEGRTNALKYSEQLDNALWLKSYVYISADIAASPNGLLSAEKLYEDSSTNVRYIYMNSMSFTSGTPYVLSFYIKPAGRNRVGLFFPNGSFGASSRHGWFDLSTGTVGGLQTGLSGFITPLSNGWFRCALIGTPSITGTGAIGIYLTQGGFADSYTGDGVSGVYVFGAQLEAGAFPTSYISTTTAAATRSADSLISPTGSWYNQSAGSFYGDLSWESATGSGYPMFIRADDTTNNNRWNLYITQSTGSLGIDTTTGGSSQSYWYATASAASGTTKVATAQSLNSANTAFNGSLKTLDTAYIPPTVTRFFLPIASANRWYKSVIYYPARVADSQLGLLTQ